MLYIVSPISFCKLNTIDTQIKLFIHSIYSSSTNNLIRLTQKPNKY